MADAPKLLGTDTLRQAYPKFNQAIDNSNSALTKATTAETNSINAVNTANEAKTQSTSTQAQLDTVIIESGTSDAETLQARTNADAVTFTTLQERLNNSDSKMADIAVNIKTFGASESIVDNTSAIQSAIDYVASLGGGVVIIPKGTFTVLGKAETIYLRSNVRIKGIGKKSVIKIHDTTGDWGSLFRFPAELIENVVIKDFTIDGNINNPVTVTDRWVNSNRVLLYLREGKSIRVENMNLISNGVWAIRGKISYSTIRNNEITFDSSTYTKTEFDVSSIWIGGEENRVESNLLRVTDNSLFTPATGIECQGHRNHYTKNTIKNYSVGFIFTASTSYENLYHVITELGSNNSKIYDNILSCRDGGVIIWPMNVPDGSIINNLTISNNTIDIIKGNSTKRSVGIGARLGNVYSSTTSDKDMTAKIHNCKIHGNTIRFDARRVNESPSAGDHGFRFEVDVEIDGLDIQGNTLINVGGMGLWLNENPMNNPSTGVVENNEWIKNVNVIGNTFREAKLGIRMSRNVSNVVIENNIFEQKATYATFTDNMIVAIQSENTTYSSNSNYKILNNRFLGPSDWKPFYPTISYSSAALSFYPSSRGMLLERNTLEIEHEKPSGIGTPITNTMQIFMLDGTRKKTTYGIGSTVGTLKSSGGSSVTITASIDSSTFTVSDATNIRPGMHLLLDSTKFNTDIVIVLAVINNNVYCSQNVGLKSGATLPSTINYFANLVTA